jgi:hypothetical protein
MRNLTSLLEFRGFSYWYLSASTRTAGRLRLVLVLEL